MTLAAYYLKKIEMQKGVSHCLRLLTVTLFPANGNVTFFLSLCLLKIPQLVTPNQTGLIPWRPELAAWTYMGPFSKTVFYWLLGWLRKQQIKSVCSSPKLSIAPVTYQFAFSNGNKNILYYGWKKKKIFGLSTTSLRFVYSCTSLMYNSVKSHRFSLCLVQGEMSCFSPAPCS